MCLTITITCMLAISKNKYQNKITSVLKAYRNGRIFSKNAGWKRHFKTLSLALTNGYFQQHSFMK